MSLKQTVLRCNGYLPDLPFFFWLEATNRSQKSPIANKYGAAPASNTLFPEHTADVVCSRLVRLQEKFWAFAVIAALPVILVATLK
ncbi:hypothetical protein EXN22_04665 [Pseudomonas tructae]|uniref:Uncharacterized protein n=1 Tax=Pseudomonas tructae TaxID=2518644 RepID=A0A411MEB1_9PSED|nr:hypothetical protein [Pseudomonas tructae]QBF25019.1 hypothetical protein EXN22_04665 [Pseudomonas tructae]